MPGPDEILKSHTGARRVQGVRIRFVFVTTLAMQLELQSNLCFS
jgi:hypothetical protein